MDFLPSIPVLTAFTIASLILTLTPGPDMTLFVGRSLSQGRAAGLASLFGASTGVVIHTLLAAFGISALIQASPNGFLALKVVGALYLLWLAVQAIREVSSFSLEETKSSPKSLTSNWLTGIGINMLNPKIILFFITFLPQFISSEDPNATGKMIFLGFYFILIATSCCVMIVYAVDKFANALKQNPKVTRAIDYLFAGVFSAFAIRILFTERG